MEKKHSIQLKCPLSSVHICVSVCVQVDNCLRLHASRCGRKYEAVPSSGINSRNSAGLISVETTTSVSVVVRKRKSFEELNFAPNVSVYCVTVYCIRGSASTFESGQ